CVRRGHRGLECPYGRASGLRARRGSQAGPPRLPRRPGGDRQAHRRRFGAGEGEDLRGISLLPLVGLFLALGGGNAVPAGNEEDLKALRSRIEALSRELEKKEEVRQEARDGLRESERAISAANRALGELRAEGDKVRLEAAAIAVRRAVLERSLAEREQAVGRMLAAQQANRAPDALRVALS